MTKERDIVITEKVSPMHPDKVADRIAGALVDYCYSMDIHQAPKCAFEVLIGHGKCVITGETSVHIPTWFVKETVRRISKERIRTKYIEVPQDKHLADNQAKEFRCGDNGVFAGYPMPKVHKIATDICQDLYEKAPYDGKIVLELKKGGDKLTICWSNVRNADLKAEYPNAKVNPIGEWTGGTSVDTGITGRKLASDFYGIMKPLGGGTMHGKDLSKADCSVNIYLFLLAQQKHREFRAICSIGDKYVNINGQLVKFDTIVKTAQKYIESIGGFEKFAEWGLQ